MAGRRNLARWGWGVTLLRGYSHELDKTIHLCPADDTRALCEIAMLVVYVQPDVVPLTHPRICPACLSRAVGRDSLTPVTKPRSP